jgi:hypothetical protein
MKMKRIFVPVCGLILFLSCTLSVDAHGGGVSFEEEKDGYFVDIGYQIDPLAFEQIRFDFDTYPLEDRGAEDVYTDVWVRISRDRELFFSGGLGNPVFGPTGFTYAFPEEGTYEILARFQNGADTVVESSFTIEVFPRADAKVPINPYGAAGVGFILGAIIAYLIVRTKKPKLK